MGPQISGCQTMLHNRSAVMANFEAMRAESLRLAQERQRAERIEQWLQKVPACYRGKTLDDFKAECPAQAMVKQVAACYVFTFPDRLKEGMGLMFLGKYGTGKTLLSMIIYQMLIKEGIAVCYEPSLRFLRLLQEKNFESYAAFKNLLDYYQHHPLLIIDEATEGFAGKEGNLSAWERQMLFSVIDARYAAGLCTLIISNRTQREVTARLGGAIADRLMERSVVLGFGWHSYRSQKLSKNL